MSSKSHHLVILAIHTHTHTHHAPLWPNSTKQALNKKGVLNEISLSLYLCFGCCFNTSAIKTIIEGNVTSYMWSPMKINKASQITVPRKQIMRNSYLHDSMMLEMKSLYTLYASMSL